MRYNIEDTIELNLNCYQNMVVALLNNAGCDITLLGAVPPWIFYKRDGSGEIVNYYIADKNIVESLYGYTIKKQNFESDNIIETLILNLNEHPLIVNVDQFYVSHHYPHIFQKQHGEHSFIVNGYDKSKRKFFCVDSIPKYTGEISFEALELAIKNFPAIQRDKQYGFIEKINNTKIDNIELFNNFVKLSKAYMNNNHTNVYFSNFANVLFINKLICGQNKDIFSEIKNLLKGVWMWELDRTATWTIRYLNTQYVKQIYGEERVNCLSKQILECNLKVVAAYRILYKSTITKSMEELMRGVNKLKEAVEMQEVIFDSINTF